MSNFYSEHTFCEALGAAYFSENTVQPKIFESGQQLWKIPALHSKKPISRLQFQSTFIDFYEPLSIPAASSLKAYSKARPSKIAYLPRVCHGMVTSHEWLSQKLDKIYEPAPTVKWSEFSSWKEFENHVKNKRSNLFSDSRRRHRKLERELGYLNFVWHDPRPETLATCIDWKSEQYRRSGYIDSFAYREHVKLFQELAERGLLIISTLTSGERLIAAHIGVSLGKRLYSWLPAYDVDFSSYAPGRLLFLFVLKESFERDYQEFDFLIGDEPYKWYYATHVRLISELGRPPLTLKIFRGLRATLRPLLPTFMETVPGLGKRGKKIWKALIEKYYQLSR